MQDGNVVARCTASIGIPCVLESEYGCYTLASDYGRHFLDVEYGPGILESDNGHYVLEVEYGGGILESDYCRYFLEPK